MAGPVNNVFAVESSVVEVILKDLKCSVPCIMDGARENSHRTRSSLNPPRWHGGLRHRERRGIMLCSRRADSDESEHGPKIDVGSEFEGLLRVATSPRLSRRR